MKNVPLTVGAEVISNEDRERLEAAAAELERAELTDSRRVELMEIASGIAEKYSCDARLCE